MMIQSLNPKGQILSKGISDTRTGNKLKQFLDQVDFPEGANPHKANIHVLNEF